MWKKSRVLENRLDNVCVPPMMLCHHVPHAWVLQALKSFNSGLALNATLWQRLDHFRQEREVFESMYKKLQKLQR